MVIEISETILRRLDNYAAAAHNRYREAEKRQWMTLTLDTIRSCEEAKARAQRAAATAAYSRYLYQVQRGLSETRSIYGEPLLSRALVEQMHELGIPVRLAEEPRH